MKKSKSRFIIQDHPIILEFFASKNPFQVGLYIVPIMIIFFKLSSGLKLDFLTQTGLVLIGILNWTLIEYLIHRYVYHVKFPFKWMDYTIGSFHTYHHSNMKDLRVLNAGLIMIYILTPLFFLPILLIVSDFQISCLIMFGTLLGYYAYEWVHYLIHYKHYETGYMAYIQKYHMHHHDHAPLKNFGNTSHLWDFIFRTQDTKYKNYEMNDKTKSTLITSQKKIETTSESQYA